MDFHNKTFSITCTMHCLEFYSYVFGVNLICTFHMYICINPLSAKFTKWSNTLKQLVGKLPTNCLSVFDHFVGLALKGLSYKDFHMYFCLLLLPMAVFVTRLVPSCEISKKIYLCLSACRSSLVYQSAISSLTFHLIWLENHIYFWVKLCIFYNHNLSQNIGIHLELHC